MEMVQIIFRLHCSTHPHPHTLLVAGGQAEEDRWRGRANGALSLLILPRSLLVAARGPGGAGIPPALRFGAPKLAALALISRAYAPRPRPPSSPTRCLKPPSAATRDYAPSRGDGLRPATRHA